MTAVYIGAATQNQEPSMTLYNVMKLFHIVAAIIFVGGIFARQTVRAYARKTNDIVWFATLSRAASHVENRMIRPWSFIVLALGLIEAHLGGLPMLGFLQGESQNWLLVSNFLFLSGFALIPLVFVPHGKAFRPVMEAALAEGRITDPLRRAMDDRVLKLTHLYEQIVLLVIVALMVLKPF
jgi:uncharacterized membrane protein